MQSHHACGNVLEEIAQPQREAEDRVGDDSLLYIGASLVLQNALEFCAILQVFYHENAFIFFAGDGCETPHIDCHSILDFKLQTL